MGSSFEEFSKFNMNARKCILQSDYLVEELVSIYNVDVLDEVYAKCDQGNLPFLLIQSIDLSI
jgi:hypothetical protein